MLQWRYAKVAEVKLANLPDKLKSVKLFSLLAKIMCMGKWIYDSGNTSISLSVYKFIKIIYITILQEETAEDWSQSYISSRTV